jgi:hypothetical protein
MPTRFEEQYHCYSVAYADKSHLEVSKHANTMLTMFNVSGKRTVKQL